MALRDKLPSSTLGLAGQTPPTFDVDPSAALHNLYSVDGTPNVRWVANNPKANPAPPPSQLDELDLNAPKLKITGVVSQMYKSKTGQRYKDLGPVDGRY